MCLFCYKSHRALTSGFDLVSTGLTSSSTGVALLLCMALLAPLASAQTLLQQFETPNPNQDGAFGFSVAGVPDADGDGVADLLIGAPFTLLTGDGFFPGRVYLYSGATGALLNTLESPNPERGANPDSASFFGFSVAGIDDVDGDGRGDLLIGAQRENGGAEDAGRAYLFSGATGAVLFTLEPTRPEAIGQFGDAVTGVADTDGDGVADLLVGAPMEFPGGRAYLFSGATGALLRRIDAPSFLDEAFGRSVAGIGDVDGDGLGDFIVGAESVEEGDVDFAGGVYVFSGGTGALLRTLESPNSENRGRFGFSVAGVPDADGDGETDLLVGAEGEGGFQEFVGRAYLYSGTTGALLHTLESPNPEPFGSFGGSVTGVEDVDGDGRGDLFIGADGEQNAGRAYLFSGATGELLRTVASPDPFAEGIGGNFGESVAGVEDIDGDGRGDFLVGAIYEGAGNTGQAYLFSGSVSTPPASDTTRPECEIVAIDPGPPTTLRVRTRDGGSGLASITVRQDKNATVTVPAFTPGLQTNVFVTAEKVDERKRSTVVLEVKDRAGNTTVCDPVVTTVSAEVPEAFELGANYPNPFNPTTRITFKLAEPSDLRLAVYDALGREVALLVSDRMEAGSYEVAWEGTDASGRVLPSGVYLYRMEAGAFTKSRTMTLVK